MKNIILALSFILFNFLYLPNTYADDLLEVENRVIKIYQETVPSVVNVANIKYADSFFYGRVEVPQGTGTGFVWDDQGHIVTNFHVVQGGNSFMVNFHKDKKQYKAKVVGVAPKQDIAVLKLETMPKNLKPITIGTSSDLKVGQLALALGNPYGFDHSLTKGIISAVGRKIDGIGGVKIHDMIQTDAAINQGNSGGPLLNSSGKLIGVNTMIVSRSGSSAGLGFAVPIDTVKRIAPQLIKHGKVIRPGLGVGILDEEIRKRYVGDKGAILSFVDPEGPAHDAGLKGMMRDSFGRIYIGDIILEINGKEVNSRDDIYHELGKYKIGDTITILYQRENKRKKVKVTLKPI
ncbi:MAG: trypsin-like peptidase domain-containing protein [Bacteriovoracaceae bacterium]|jgi:S1-C subfamily serine protease|nr:trypsin-like peptidase domain-containing protein [Bacteriovoracaceae bacterium]